MTTTATEVLCSENPQGSRLMSMLWRYPKFVHQESLRHRTLYIEDQLANLDFSFSVSSSRAIPFAKMLEEVRSDELRAAPVSWGAEQRGMSPGDELDDTDKSVFWPEVWKTLHIDEMTTMEWITKRECAKRLWAEGARLSAKIAEVMVDATGVHKSIANRMIETYVHVNCLVTGTTPGWMNFFGLRLDGAADPTLRALAEAAWRVWNKSKPRKLDPSQWHLPFVSDEDHDDVEAAVSQMAYRSTARLSETDEAVYDRLCLERAICISVARCARLSYMSFETGKRSTIEEDLALYARLVGGPIIHASPAEHQATPDVICGQELIWVSDDAVEGIPFWKYKHQAGNLGPGWRQYRKMLPGEAVAPLPEGLR